jgi:hypothetical protein
MSPRDYMKINENDFIILQTTFHIYDELISYPTAYNSTPSLKVRTTMLMPIPWVNQSR